MGSIVVENIKSKNLYNPALTTMINNNYYFEFEIDNTEPYVFQSPYDWTLVYGIDASGNETRSVYETGKGQDSRVVTFVPNSNEVKIKCAFYTENFQGYNGVQLEQNNSVTNYSKYIDFEGRINIITGQECPTNIYVDNKRVYVKRVDCGYMPNGTTKYVSTGLTNITIEKMEGKAKCGNTQIVLPYIEPGNSSSYNIALVFVGEDILLKCDNDQSPFYGYVDVYYTKN